MVKSLARSPARRPALAPALRALLLFALGSTGLGPARAAEDRLVVVQLEASGLPAGDPVLVELHGDGQVVPMRPQDDGQAPDEQAGDGVLTASAPFSQDKFGLSLTLGEDKLLGNKVRFDGASPLVLRVRVEDGAVVIEGSAEQEPREPTSTPPAPPDPDGAQGQLPAPASPTNPAGASTAAAASSPANMDLGFIVLGVAVFLVAAVVVFLVFRSGPKEDEDPA